MKKNIFLLLSLGLAWGITSCTTNDEDMFDNTLPREFKTSRFRSYDEALNVAKSAASMVDEKDGKSRGTSSERTINTISGVKVVTTPGSRSASPDTLMYVFNFDNNEGFAVVSAVPESEPLLAVTESGYYDPNVEPENPGFAMYMDRAKAYVANALSAPPTPGTPSGPTWGNDTIFMGEMTINCDSVITSVQPINHHAWGVNSPYGDRCPNGVSGCTQTAIGMIMAHFEQPISMTFNYPELPASYVSTIDWTKVNNHLSNFLCNDYAHQGDSIIARIMRQIGYDFGANYYYYTTYTGAQQALNVLKNKYGYTCTPLASYTTYDYRQELEDGAIAFVSVKHVYPNLNMEEHHLLMNGYTDVSYKTKTFQLYRFSNMPSNVLYYSKLLKEEDKLTAYWHLNWGRDGYDNGYYYSGVFNTNDCQINDFYPSSHSNNIYNYDPQFSFVKFRASRPGKL